MIKLIACDLDGTLLTSTHQLPENFWEIYNYLEKHGVSFVIASGRQYRNIQKLFVPHEKELYYIAENGAIVMNGEKEVSLHAIPMSEVKKIVKCCQNDLKQNFVMCSKNNSYIFDTDLEFAKHIQRYCANPCIIKSLDELDEPIVKIAVRNAKNAEEKTFPILHNISEKCEATLSGVVWVDVICKGINKGNALKELQKNRGISQEETICFGDYLNDIEMMQNSRISYSMQEAHPNVKKIATEIIGDNNDFAVTKKLIEIFNIPTSFEK